MGFTSLPVYLRPEAAEKTQELRIKGRQAGIQTKTVLFDLDGTLLPVDLDFFFKRYMDDIASYFESIIPPKMLVEAILTATYAMIGNTDPHVSNMQAFAHAFAPLVGREWDYIWPKFQRFYEKEFPKLRRFVPDSVVAHSVIQHCVDSGWDIVLATNPVFPELAVRERMRWCNIHEFPWRLITTLDNMHFCKPHLEYYLEILERLSLSPDDCVMVGNDVQEDMCAKELGMKTFLVEDFLVTRGKGSAPDGRGTLLDVISALDRMLGA